MSIKQDNEGIHFTYYVNSLLARSLDNLHSGMRSSENMEHSVIESLYRRQDRLVAALRSGPSEFGRDALIYQYCLDLSAELGAIAIMLGNRGDCELMWKAKRSNEK